jgi:hypothetical protein
MHAVNMRHGHATLEHSIKHTVHVTARRTMGMVSSTNSTVDVSADRPADANMHLASSPLPVSDQYSAPLPIPRATRHLTAVCVCACSGRPWLSRHASSQPGRTDTDHREACLGRDSLGQTLCVHVLQVIARFTCVHPCSQQTPLPAACELST